MDEPETVMGPAGVGLGVHPVETGGRFLPGTLVGGRYRMIGLLGRGGMGEVYRADDLKLGQPVALKFLPLDVEGDPNRLERFLNEVRTSLRVTHPNVCRVFDVGQIDQRHFLSMEYVDGEDLGSLLRRIGRLPENKLARVGLVAIIASYLLLFLLIRFPVTWPLTQWYSTTGVIGLALPLVVVFTAYRIVIRALARPARSQNR